MNEENEAKPSWSSLLLPPGVGAPMRPIPAASLAAHVDLGGLYPVASAFQLHNARQFWLSTVHAGRVPLQGGWGALGNPSEVLVVETQDDPGVALVNANGWKPGKYRKSKVGIVGNAGRVSLSAASLHRLQLERDGSQVLLTLVEPFLVLLNPNWLSELTYWDEAAMNANS